jgi:hypothetical protein
VGGLPADQCRTNTKQPLAPPRQTTGFGHEATLGAASLVLDAIKARGPL